MSKQYTLLFVDKMTRRHTRKRDEPLSRNMKQKDNKLPIAKITNKKTGHTVCKKHEQKVNKHCPIGNVTHKETRNTTQ